MLGARVFRGFALLSWILFLNDHFYCNDEYYEFIKYTQGFVH